MVPSYGSAPRDLNSPRRILLIGDFSAAGHCKPRSDPIDGRSILPVDVDNFDDVFSRIRPTLSSALPLQESTAATIEFRSIEDFHPDSLYQRLDALKTLWAARQRQLDSPSDAIEDPQGDPAQPATEHDTDTFERLLGNRPTAISHEPSRQITPDLAAWLKQVVEPHVVPAPGPRHDQLVRAYDEAAASLMRAVLHDPAFRALESLWRSVDRILREVESDGRVEFDLLDVTQAEVEADLQSTTDWRGSGLYRRLESAAGNWSLLAADFVFGNQPNDVLMLATLGAIAAELQAPFLSAAKLEVCGCRSVDELTDPRRWPPVAAVHEASWQKLRRSGMARWLGLALPRVLMRLPYGAATDPIDRFPFEEMTAADNHEELLWGNPAFACAYLAARAMADGRALGEASLDLDDLPPYTLQREDGPHLKPCGEVYLNDRAADAILTRGVMPLLSHRNRSAVRLARWQSAADPPAMLGNF